MKIVTKPLASLAATIRVPRELKVMRHLCACAPIVTMHFTFRCGQSVRNPWGDVYIVMGLVETDVGDLIQSGMVSTDMLRILQGLKCMHRCGIVHRDLKP